MRLRDGGRMIARRDPCMLQRRKRVDQKAEVCAYKQVIPTEGRVSEGPVSCGRHRTGDQLSSDFADKVRTGNGFRDPAFSENKTQLLHRWVPWIAGISAQFIQDCFETFYRLRDQSLCRSRLKGILSLGLAQEVRRLARGQPIADRAHMPSAGGCCTILCTPEEFMGE